MKLRYIAKSTDEKTLKRYPRPTENQLARINHLRDRAGLAAMSMEQLCIIWDGVTADEMKEIMERIGD